MLHTRETKDNNNTRVKDQHSRKKDLNDKPLLGWMQT
jgi:hypothetical protein